MVNYFRNWNFMRILRLAMGIFVIVTGVQVNDWMFVSLGLIFSAMPIFNIGCCGINTCTTNNCAPAKTSTELNTKEITYEEVK